MHRPVKGGCNCKLSWRRFIFAAGNCGLLARDRSRRGHVATENGAIRMSGFRFVVCLGVILLAPGQAAVAAEELQAGVAVVDITPPIPFRMSGYFMERLSTGTKDPLHAKAIVFQQGDEA